VYSKAYTFQILLGFSVTLKTSQTLTLLGPTNSDSIGVAHTLKLTFLKKYHLTLKVQTVLALNERVISELWIGKDMEGSSRGLV
jgi:hypothetical protein